MTERELRKKIVEITISTVWKDSYGDEAVIDRVAAEQLADALIAAGIGDTKAAIREFAEKLKEKVLTLILKELKVKTIDEARALSVIDSLIVGDALYDDIENIFNKAEKELAEERKDD